MSKLKQEQRKQHFATRRLEAIDCEPDVRKELAKRTMNLRVGLITVGKTISFHWMIETWDGRRIVDYWPARGSWRSEFCGQSGECLDPVQIVQVASIVAAGLEYP